VDGQGNVFVTGYSVGSGSSEDYTTVAYSGAGQPLWTNRYNGPANSSDYVLAVAADGQGDVFVTGSSVGSGSLYDYVTIAYSGAGVPLWTNRYNGPGDSDDGAQAVVVDAQSNVFVTGYSVGSGSSSDYVTISYSGAGVPLWTNRYNGPANSSDYVLALAADGQGNVFVTGSSVGSGSLDDYATIKYRAIGADELVYVPSTNFFGTDSFSYVVQDSFGLTSTGTVMVTVYSPPFITAQPVGATNLAGTTASFTVLADGTAKLGYQWLKAGSLLADGGNVSGATSNILALSNVQSADATNYAVVITNAHGSVTSSVATLTLLLPPGIAQEPQNASAQCGTGSASFSVTATGTEPLSYQWRFIDASIPGATGTNYTVSPTTPDTVGSYTVVVTNLYGSITSSIATLTLTNPTPTVANADALNTYRNLALTFYPSTLTSNDVAGSCNGFNTNLAIISVSPTSANGGSVQFAPAGTSLWSNRYSFATNITDIGRAVAVDGSGNVFVTGASLGSDGLYDYATVAYSSLGQPLWTNRYSFGTSKDDLAYAMAVDGSGNVFVTGASLGSDVYYDYTTVAYSGAGQPLWTNRYSFATAKADIAQAMAVDGSGNVFVTGYSTGGDGYKDYATVAYSGAGQPLWTNRYSFATNQDDYANAMAVDGSGNVFVTGYSTGNDGYYDYATVAYSGAGQPLWTNRYSFTTNKTDVARAVAADGSGKVFVTGHSLGSGGFSDYATVAYSGAGQPLWTNRYSFGANQSDDAHAVAVDGSGNVFVTGSSVSGDGSYDFATVAYSGAGQPLWTNRYSNLVNNSDGANAVAVDASGNAFVTGLSVGSDGYKDYATVAYSGAGQSLWTNHYSFGANQDDEARAVAVDGSGNVFLTGQSVGTDGSYDYATIKYAGGNVIYTPPTNFTGTDSFTYVVQDSLGLTATGTVTVSVSALPPPTIFQAPAVVNGNFVVHYSGVPGATYQIEVRPGIASPWQPFTTLTASPIGEIIFSTPITNDPMRFFRAIPAP
jgi:hypothetical protein